MQKVSESNLIAEYSGEQCFSYLLADNNLFLNTAYKVMCLQENKGLVPCRKLLWNGQIELLYETGSAFSFANMLSNIDDATFLQTVCQVVSVLLSIQNIDFLSHNNVVIQFDKIFVNQKTKQVQLVYLPLSRTLYTDESSVEKELRAALLDVLAEKQHLNTQRLAPLMHHLSLGTLGLQELYQVTQNNVFPANTSPQNPIPNEVPPVPQSIAQNLQIVGLGPLAQLRFCINAQRFVMGRNPHTAHACLQGNNAVGREHCEIVLQNNAYYVKDLNSTNGTFLNENRLMPQQAYPLNEGDVLRVANCEFKVYAQ